MWVDGLVKETYFNINPSGPRVCTYGWWGAYCLVYEVLSISNAGVGQWTGEGEVLEHKPERSKGIHTHMGDEDLITWHIKSNPSSLKHKYEFWSPFKCNIWNPDCYLTLAKHPLNTSWLLQMQVVNTIWSVGKAMKGWLIRPANTPWLLLWGLSEREYILQVHIRMIILGVVLHAPPKSCIHKTRELDHGFNEMRKNIGLCPSFKD